MKNLLDVGWQDTCDLLTGCAHFLFHSRSKESSSHGFMKNCSKCRLQNEKTSWKNWIEEMTKKKKKVAQVFVLHTGVLLKLQPLS